MIRLRTWLRACGLLACAALVLTLAVAADFEVTGPDGRRILLKDDGTWRYVDGKDKGSSKELPRQLRPKKSRKWPARRVLILERRVEAGGACMFGLRIVNGFPHIIQSLFPTFSAVRANGVVYDSVSQGFQAVRPGDSQSRELVFRGISCQEIARVQVSGGDRCVMGDLDRFSFDSGVCLSRVRVVESKLVRFDKE